MDNSKNAGSKFGRKGKTTFNTFFKKNLTLGKHFVMQTIGKADSIEFPQDYQELNNRFKQSYMHYKDVEKYGKKAMKDSSLVGTNEGSIGDCIEKVYIDLKGYEAEINPVVLTKKKRVPKKDRPKVERKEGELPNAKTLSDDTVDFLDCIGKLGETIKSIGSLRNELDAQVGETLTTVHELLEDGSVCKEIKEEYREVLLDLNVKQNTMRQLKEKSSDLLKIKKAENEREEAKNKSKIVHVDVMEELKYQLDKRNTEYTKGIFSMVQAYKKYFIVGAELIKQMEQEIKEVNPDVYQNLLKNENIEPIERTHQPQCLTMEYKQAKKGLNTTLKKGQYGAGHMREQMKQNVKETKLFGKPLQELMLTSKIEKGDMPLVVEQMMEYILQEGIEVEGIFRLAGDVNEMARLKKQADFGFTNIEFSKFRNVNVIASSFKQYIRELPEPILTYKLYDEFLSVPTMDSAEAKVSKLNQLLAQIPTFHALFLNRLLQMMTAIAAKSEINCMTPSNLAIVFGLNILRPVDNDNPLVLARDSKNINSVFNLLVVHYDSLKLTLESHRAKGMDLLREKFERMNDETSSVMSSSQDDLLSTSPTSTHGGLQMDLIDSSQESQPSNGASPRNSAQPRIINSKSYGYASNQSPPVSKPTGPMKKPPLPTRGKRPNPPNLKSRTNRPAPPKQFTPQQNTQPPRPSQNRNIPLIQFRPRTNSSFKQQTQPQPQTRNEPFVQQNNYYGQNNHKNLYEQNPINFDDQVDFDMSSGGGSALMSEDDSFNYSDSSNRNKKKKTKSYGLLDDDEDSGVFFGDDGTYPSTDSFY